MICKNPSCNFAWHCFTRGRENREFIPPCASLKEREKKNVSIKSKDNGNETIQEEAQDGM